MPPEAIKLVLQKRSSICAPRDLANLLNSSRELRTTALQCHAAGISVSVSNAAMPGFASWLMKHSNLVGDISIGADVHDEAPLLHSLQAVAAAAAAAAAPFALRSFSSCYGNMHHSTALVDALPAASLTCLQLGQLPDEGYRSLGAKVNLQRLELRDVPGSYLEHLPCQLLELHLTTLTDEPQHLSHLQRLTRLSLTKPGNSIRPGSKLPVSLRHLEVDLEPVIGGQIAALGITGLQQLQQLSLRQCKEPAGALASLTAMQHLTELELCFTQHGFAAGAQPYMLRGLPMLRRLHFSVENLEEDEDDEEVVEGAHFQQWKDAVARASSSLTSLSWHLYNYGNYAPLMSDVCSRIAGLTHLRELSLRIGSSSVQLDALHLTSLTQLTSLRVCRAGVGDFAAAEIACELQQLQDLWLERCSISNAAVLAPIRRLRQLRQLTLVGNKGLATNENLQLLTRLRKLTSLQLIDKQNVRPSLQAENAFWAALRSLQQQQ
ncbi:hypothetical protein OEZ85_011079 [Tetradesmus obliquus]|uniref:Uncharacterized protein n=1 Tax=Tetradesmus obliquus TaxID=3088 RepID=A0ABY8TP63_TETOB|nr:hypothetical protein OEZ85_011079 [Tetradesmus obliquus]